MKNILGLGAAALAIPAAIAAAGLLNPVAASADPGASPMNVIGEPYYKATAMLKSLGIKQRFDGSFAGQVNQAQCIVDQQKLTKQNVMLLHLDCTQAAADHATDSTPAAPGAGAAPGAPAPGAGQGTYGGPIGVPVNVG